MQKNRYTNCYKPLKLNLSNGWDYDLIGQIILQQVMQEYPCRPFWLAEILYPKALLWQGNMRDTASLFLRTNRLFHLFSIYQCSHIGIWLGNGQSDHWWWKLERLPWYIGVNPISRRELSSLRLNRLTVFNNHRCIPPLYSISSFLYCSIRFNSV